MNPITMRAAAAERGARVAAPADRPSQRRCSEDLGSGARVSTQIRNLQLRASVDGGPVTFDGYASVTGTGYDMWDWAGPYTESVDPGAFAVTLARAGLDVPLVLQHMDLRRIARTTNGTLTLTEDETGLNVLAELDPADEDVAYIVPKLRSGLVDEMSFKFRIVSGLWSPDWTEYHINEVDIHRGDVAIVGYGANPATVGAGVRTGFDVEEVLRGLDDTHARLAFDALRVRLAPTSVRALVTDEDAALRY